MTQDKAPRYAIAILIALLVLAAVAYVLSVEEEGALELQATQPDRDPPAGTPGARYHETTVNIYYYDAARDTENGNVLCSERGLVAVPRTVNAPDTPLRAALELLLAGEPAGEGLTPFPKGVIYEDYVVSDGIARVWLSDPQGVTSGGACKASILRAQLEQTVRQFRGITGVELIPDPNGLFQP